VLSKHQCATAGDRTLIMERWRGFKDVSNPTTEGRSQDAHGKMST